MDKTSRAKLNVIISMTIYGTIGLFVRNIDLPSSVISMIRGIIGAPFLLAVLAVKKQKINFESIKANLRYLILSGSLLGFNWILLFEAYRYTTVSTATLCYYLAPIIIVALSPVMFREKITLKKILCIITAVIGMAFVSGFAAGKMPELSEIRGIILATGAAVFYAFIVIFNKKLSGISAYDRTIFQLALSAVILIPYNFITGAFSGFSLTGSAVWLLLILGIVHTGIAYLLYFGSAEFLSSQTIAILGYIDPLVALLVSAFILKESMGLGEIVGAVLIIGSALASELPSGAEQ